MRGRTASRRWMHVERSGRDPVASWFVARSNAINGAPSLAKKPLTVLCAADCVAVVAGAVILFVVVGVVVLAASLEHADANVAIAMRAILAPVRDGWRDTEFDLESFGGYGAQFSFGLDVVV